MGHGDVQHYVRRRTKRAANRPKRPYEALEEADGSDGDSPADVDGTPVVSPIAAGDGGGSQSGAGSGTNDVISPVGGSGAASEATEGGLSRGVQTESNVVVGVNFADGDDAPVASPIVAGELQGETGGSQAGAGSDTVDVISPGAGSGAASEATGSGVAVQMNFGIAIENFGIPDGDGPSDQTPDMHSTPGASMGANTPDHAGGPSAGSRSRGVPSGGSGSSVREVGGSSSSGVPSVTLTGFAFGVGRPVCVKPEIGENFPATYGLSHEEPVASAVLNFVGKMMSCSPRELDRKWFKHTRPTRVQLNGWDFKIEFGPGGRITFIGWSAVHRMMKFLEFKIYGYSPARWRHIFDPRFAQHLMNLDIRHIDYEYMNTMMSFADLG